MDIIEIMKVRQYNGKKIEDGKRETLNRLIKECNAESGLNIQIIFEEPKCFDSMMAHYGRVSAKAGRGFYTKMDLGIVKYHFEAATGHKVE